MSWRTDLEARMDTNTIVTATATVTFPTETDACDARENDVVADIIADAVGVEDARVTANGRVITVVSDVWVDRAAVAENPVDEHDRVSSLIQQGLHNGLPATVHVDLKVS